MPKLSESQISQTEKLSERLLGQLREATKEAADEAGTGGVAPIVTMFALSNVYANIVYSVFHAGGGETSLGSITEMARDILNTELDELLKTYREEGTRELKLVE